MTFLLVPHDRMCSYLGRDHSDAAKRISDTYRLHRMADIHGAIGRWFAAALADGTTDNVLYDSKQSCITHQHHNELLYAYVRIGPHDMTPCDAETFLKIQRKLYDKGLRMVDPDARNGGPVMIPRTSREDMGSQMRSILYGTRPSNLKLPRGD